MQNIKNFNYEIVYNNKNWLIICMSIEKIENFKFFYRYNIPERRNKRRVKNFMLPSLLSLIFVLILIFSLNNIKTSNKKLYDRFYIPYNIDFVTRSATKDSINYSVNSIVSHFILGGSLQQQGNYEEAIKEYQIVITDNDSLFVEQSKWYMGLCYLKTNQNEKAFEQFKNLSQNKGYYQTKAKRIMQKMSK